MSRSEVAGGFTVAVKMAVPFSIFMLHRQGERVLIVLGADNRENRPKISRLVDVHFRLTLSNSVPPTKKPVFHSPAA